MSLKVVGAGLPRTGTQSLATALSHLLGGPSYHMSVIPGHPFNLGEAWTLALSGDMPDWNAIFKGYVASLDWPASMFWRELSAANPYAPVILSIRESAEAWWQSANETILPVARMALAPGWSAGCGLVSLLERFTGTPDWDDPAVLMAAYERHNAQVKAEVPASRLLEWRASDGWEPLCRALYMSVPDRPFPWVNRRRDWG
jgi:hypothetical protein